MLLIPLAIVLYATKETDSLNKHSCVSLDCLLFIILLVNGSGVHIIMSFYVVVTYGRIWPMWAHLDVSCFYEPLAAGKHQNMLIIDIVIICYKVITTFFTALILGFFTLQWQNVFAVKHFLISTFHSLLKSIWHITQHHIMFVWMMNHTCTFLKKRRQLGLWVWKYGWHCSCVEASLPGYGAGQPEFPVGL